MKHILVTGATGFIGTNLCIRLLKEGNKVYGVDNFCTGKRPGAFNLSEIRKADTKNKFSFANLDCSKTSAHQYKEYLDIYYKLDEIYHLASPASPPKYTKLSLETIDVNTNGTKILLELAKTLGAKILFASTSEIYGDPLEHPQKESYYGNVNSFGPRSLYDESKRLGETLCYEYKRLHDVKIRIARIFNVFGPYMNPEDGRVVTNFISQGLKDKPYTVYGDGSQTRCLCYIDDMVEGLMKLVGSDCQDPINLGSENEYRVIDIAALIHNKISPDESIKVKNLVLPKDDPKQRRPDLTKAKEILGWYPEFLISKGIDKTIEYVKSYPNF